MDVNEIRENAKKLMELLGVDKPLVAVKLAKTKDEIPEGYETLEEEKRHCEMIQLARLERKKLYATADKHLCKGGAYAIGVFRNPPEPLATGKLYVKLGNYKDEEAAKKTVDAIPRVEEEIYASVYAPLDETDFVPDSIVFIGLPKHALRLVQAILYHKGGRFQADYSGIQSLCADAVAAVYTRKAPNMTLGCNGSRKYAGIQPEEAVVAFPPEKLKDIVEALEHFKQVWG
ncbi:DUF169 domain-containing protein [Methanocaldococcus fervens]|uniref:DUF169 domain-containing protein n=1 Tax=Methanocaldococcus fervens (strain DSM 4213 / JCM 15782 / AG86) TaxID=573064 RepID=C7P9A8_METFA|nr:DUF169 domain-containing protein [Methanocaldococcus fervens]ACV25140.1 protein of unknown function DUF169 [Methanocaldococcus fervens AG86]